MNYFIPGSIIDIKFSNHIPYEYQKLYSFIYSKECYFCFHKLEVFEESKLDLKASFYEKLRCGKCSTLYLLKYSKEYINYNEIHFTLDKYIVKLNCKKIIQIICKDNRDYIGSLPLFEIPNNKQLLLNKIEKYLLFT